MVYGILLSPRVLHYLICTKDREIRVSRLRCTATEQEKNVFFLFFSQLLAHDVILVINGIRVLNSRVCIAKLRVSTFSRLERQFARACDSFIAKNIKIFQTSTEQQFPIVCQSPEMILRDRLTVWRKILF